MVLGRYNRHLTGRKRYTREDQMAEDTDIEEGEILEGDGLVFDLDRMEEDTGLEEGELAEGSSFVYDFDARTEYMDRKIEDFLGDAQKEFEGGLFNGRLGPKVGVYGSFLPMHVRGPPLLTYSAAKEPSKEKCAINKRRYVGDQPPAPQPSLMSLPPGTPGADAPAGVIVPAGNLVMNHWVQCKYCQIWRLLIPTIHPDDLPDNWICKKMTWLPGLNNCKYSEDVTTVAVYKLLGLQNPTVVQVNRSLQGPQYSLAPALTPPSGLIPDTKLLDSKPDKVNRSGSKEGMGKKGVADTLRDLASNMKRMEANAGKSRSQNDVRQHPVDHEAERKETVAAEHRRYRQFPEDNVRKMKQRERDGQLDRKLRATGDEAGPGHHVEKRQTVYKPDSEDWGPSREVVREEREEQFKRVGLSRRTEFQHQHYNSPIGIGMTGFHSSDHKRDHRREFRGSGRDPERETARGRERDDATRKTRGGADFGKLDRNRPWRADERFWEEGRETRAGGASHFPGQRFERRLRWR